MAQSMIERHLASLEQQKVTSNEKVTSLTENEVTQEEESVLSMAECNDDERYMTDSPGCYGDDITDTAVDSPLSLSSSVSSRRRSSTSHRRKSTPKKRQWEPVYSDGESHDESGSEHPNDATDDELRRPDRLVIDERDTDSPESLISRDSVLSKDVYSKDVYSNDAFSKDPYSKDAYSKDALSKDAYSKDAYSKDTYFNKDTMVKDAIMAMRIKSESFDDFYKSAMTRIQQEPEVDDKRNNAQNKSNRKPEHQCPFCHYVYTSVNYLLSHLYRVHLTVDPAEFQRAIAGITAPFNYGESKSTQYSRAPHMDDSGRVIAPPADVLTPLNLKMNYDTVDGDLPIKLAKFSPSSGTSSPVSELNYRKRTSLACPKCHMRFSSRSLFEGHIRLNTCSAVELALKADCHLCGRSFESRLELDEHAKEHRAPSPVHCDTCDLWFTDPEALVQHEKLHDAQLSCQFCGLTFNSMETLKRHTETHFNSSMAALPYKAPSPPGTDSDKENSPDQEPADDNPPRKLLTQLQTNEAENLTVNDREVKTEPESPTKDQEEDKTSALLHTCAYCPTKLPDFGALMEHIAKCHTNDPTKRQPYLFPNSLNSNITNPLMTLGGFYPGMYMQNPLLLGNYDPKMFPMQPNILMTQLTKNASMEKLKADEPKNLMNLLKKEKKDEKMPLFPNAYMPPYLAEQQKTEVEEKKQRNALIQQQNESEKPFSCGQCNKRFKRNCHLQLHKRTHTDDLRSYRCPQCGMRFIQLRSLEQHLKTHSIEKPYNCDYCGKKFAQKYNLKLHIRTHTGEKPYKCSYCEMRFADPGSLNRHTRTHTGEKPYSCDYCGKKFAQKYNLHLHIRVHTHDRPFRCVYCDKRFAQKSNLLMHLKLHVEYLQQLQNGTLPNMAELLDKGDSKEGPVLPSDTELRIIETERKKIEDELVALEKAELADKILSEEGARREKAMIFNKDELAAMGKSGLALMGIDPDTASDLTLVK